MTCVRPNLFWKGWPLSRAARQCLVTCSAPQHGVNAKNEWPRLGAKPFPQPRPSNPPLCSSVCGKRFSPRRTISNLLYANRSLSHANRVSGRAFTAHRETDFGRQRRRAPIRFRTVFVSRRDRERAITPAPNRGKSRVFRGDGERGVSAGLRGGAGRTRTGNQTVISPSWQVPNAARTNTASKMIAERTGILLRTER
jgi:hypothetical protein